jgi:hypothetical protein
MGQRQGLELSEGDRRRDALYGVFDAYAAKQQRKKAEKAAEAAEPGFFGSGGGAAAGSAAGLGIGALLAAPTGGVSMIAGAGLGGAIGGAAGGLTDVAMAPGSRGAAAGSQRVANMPQNLMAYDQHYGGAARGQRQAETDLLEARTRAADRSNPTPPPWTEDIVTAIIQGYMQNTQGGQSRQKPQRLISDPTYTNLGLR